MHELANDPEPALEMPMAAAPPGASRRQTLAEAGRALAVMAAGLMVGAAGEAIPSLAATAVRRGLRYGATVEGRLLRSLPGYAALVSEQCALLAPVLNWNSISPRPGVFLPGTDGGVVRFGLAHGLRLTGAHLLWHEVVPKWFGRLPNAAAARRAIETHIAQMGAAYGSATWSINVVNEVLNPRSGRADGLRQDVFAEHLGSEYIPLAFTAARRAFPGSLLLLNDYGMEQEGGDMQGRRTALLRVLDALLKAAAPIDGVGLQSHLTLARDFDPPGYAAFLHQIASRGLRIVVTELDVLDVAAPAAIPARDRAVAGLYRRYLHAALANRHVAGVVTWGISDRDTWLTSATSPRFARRDGLPARPLPFDRNLRPKPAYFAILDCFNHAPPRPLV